jgi:hypothetical protein
MFSNNLTDKQELAIARAAEALADFFERHDTPPDFVYHVAVFVLSAGCAMDPSIVPKDKVLERFETVYKRCLAAKAGM